ALDQSSLDENSKRQLAGLRSDLFGVCGPAADDTLQAKISTFVDAAKDQAEKDFATYLLGSFYFYASKFDKSIEMVSLLKESKIPWVREASSLVLARSYLVRAQKNWSGYGDRKNIDLADLEKAEAQLSDNLQQFPNGFYRRSAEGLLRRVAWLRGKET